MLYSVFFSPYLNDTAGFLTGLVVPQPEHHIRGSFKEPDIFLPAHTAATMLQADELLFHLSPTVGADLVAFSHCFISPLLHS